MLTKEEIQLFESVARGNPRFAEYLQRELDKQITVLIGNPDESQIRKAQGSAQVLQKLIENLNLHKQGR